MLYLADNRDARQRAIEFGEETGGIDSASSPGLGGRRPPRARLTRDQAQLTHDLADQLGAAVLALARQCGVDPAVPVGLPWVRFELELAPTYLADLLIFWSSSVVVSQH